MNRDRFILFAQVVVIVCLVLTVAMMLVKIIGVVMGENNG